MNPSQKHRSRSKRAHPSANQRAIEEGFSAGPSERSGHSGNSANSSTSRQQGGGKTASNLGRNDRDRDRDLEDFAEELQQPGRPPSHVWAEVGLYVVSGIFLILIMEQFVQIGLHMR
jgi:hypothetical protein